MSDIRTVLVKDSVIGDIGSDIDFAVYSGGAQNTYQLFPSTSNSNSSMVFAITVPSENCIIDRAVMITTPLSLTITIDSNSASYQALNPATGTTVFNYGATDCLQAFPLASLMNTITAQINNTTVSVNLQDVLPAMLKMNSVQHLSRYGSMTPFFPDTMFGEYSDAKNCIANVLSSANNSIPDYRYLPRGAHPVKISVVHTADGIASFKPDPAKADTTAVVPAINDTSLLVAALAPTPSSPVTPVRRANEKWVITVETIVTEPLFLSPFIYGDAEYNNQGLVGINNMNFLINIDTNCRRVFSTSSKFITSIALSNPNGFQLSSPMNAGCIGTLKADSKPALLFRFLSSQPSDLIQSKNVVPYLDFPRYLTSSNNTNTIGATKLFNDDGSPIAGATANRGTVITSNLQINQIPDKFIVMVRYPMSQQDWTMSSSFLTITGVSVNFNNQSGLLSSASMYDLWRMSVRNGSQQGWDEYSGQMFVNTPQGSSLNAFGGGIGKTVPTIGSLLVINPAFDLSLPDYITCGSLGNYNIQMTIQVTNQFNRAVQPEVCIVAVNSGIFCTQQGVSSVYQGLLTKEMVLATKQEHPAGSMTSTELSRKIGGSMLNSSLTAIGKMKSDKRKGGASAGALGGAQAGRLSKHY